MSSAPPHVVQVGFHLDPQDRAPAVLLDEWPTLVDVAEAAHSAGLRVSVVQACGSRENLTRHGLPFHFSPPGDDLCRLVRRLVPDVLHVHGLGFPDQVLQLSLHCPGVPLLLRDHASRPPRPWMRRRCRRAFAAASGFAFCSREQSLAFSRMGLIRPPSPIFEIPESTSRFTPGSRIEARARTGLAGDPCLLWVGHLDANKDPLTVLEGLSRAAHELPDPALWCCFGRAPLGRAVARRIRGDPRLRGRVHLLGRRPHQEIELMMRAADIFVSASHRESTGYALLEALSCGLTPLVTDIPSFRAMTGGGGVGRLWRPGDPRSLAEALRALAPVCSPAQRSAVRAHFDRELSLPALGRRLAACYRTLINRSGAS